MSFIINLILFLLLLTVIICIHELGHLAEIGRAHV